MNVPDCQNGGDLCRAGRFDGVVCPAESCDIDDGVRVAPVTCQCSESDPLRCVVGRSIRTTVCRCECHALACARTTP